MSPSKVDAAVDGLLDQRTRLIRMVEDAIDALNRNNTALSELLPMLVLFPVEADLLRALIQVNEAFVLVTRGNLKDLRRK